MRKIYNKFLSVPKQDKISSKVLFLRLLVLTTVVMVCLISLCFTAYAFFSSNVTSGQNVIKSANFETDIKIEVLNQSNELVAVDYNTSDYGIHKITGLEEGKEYTITITSTENSTATTGFAEITAQGCDLTYHTQQIGVDTAAPSGRTDSVTFKLTLSKSTEVTVVSKLGTSSCYEEYLQNGDLQEKYVTNNEEIVITVN